MKLCTGCDETKPLDQYHISRATPDGHKNICKQCSKEYAQHYYANNREIRIKRVMDWQRANPEKVAKYKAKFYAKGKKNE